MIHDAILAWLRDAERDPDTPMQNGEQAAKAIQQKYGDDLHKAKVAWALWSTPPINRNAALVAFHHFENWPDGVSQIERGYTAQATDQVTGPGKQRGQAAVEG